MVHGWFYVVYLFSDFRLWSLMRWPFTRFICIALGGVVPVPLVLPRGAHRARGARRTSTREDARPHVAAPAPRRPDAATASPTWRPSSDRPARRRDRQPTDAAPRARRRLRRAVRAADRAARARGRRLLRDRAAHASRPTRSRAKNPVGIVLSGGPSSVYEHGRPALDPGILELGVPDARHLLRLPGDGAAARRRGRAHRPPRVRRRPRSPPARRRRRAARRPARPRRPCG